MQMTVTLRAFSHPRFHTQKNKLRGISLRTNRNNMKIYLVQHLHQLTRKTVNCEMQVREHVKMKNIICVAAVLVTGVGIAAQGCRGRRDGD